MKLGGTNTWLVKLATHEGALDRHKVYGDLHYTRAGTATVVCNDCMVLGIRKGWGLISVDDDND
jgi:hypothetical protein